MGQNIKLILIYLMSLFTKKNSMFLTERRDLKKKNVMSFKFETTI